MKSLIHILIAILLLVGIIIGIDHLVKEHKNSVCRISRGLKFFGISILDSFCKSDEPKIVGNIRVFEPEVIDKKIQEIDVSAISVFEVVTITASGDTKENTSEGDIWERIAGFYWNAVFSEELTVTEVFSVPVVTELQGHWWREGNHYTFELPEPKVLQPAPMNKREIKSDRKIGAGGVKPEVPDQLWNEVLSILSKKAREEVEGSGGRRVRILSLQKTTDFLTNLLTDHPDIEVTIVWPDGY